MKMKTTANDGGDEDHREPLEMKTTNLNDYFSPMLSRIVFLLSFHMINRVNQPQRLSRRLLQHFLSVFITGYYIAVYRVDHVSNLSLYSIFTGNGKRLLKVHKKKLAFSCQNLHDAKHCTEHCLRDVVVRSLRGFCPSICFYFVVTHVLTFIRSGKIKSIKQTAQELKKMLSMMLLCPMMISSSICLLNKCKDFGLIANGFNLRILPPLFASAWTISTLCESPTRQITLGNFVMTNAMLTILYFVFLVYQSPSDPPFEKREHIY